ncbi:MAG: YbhB/YbcL family Raf kinase inhibitor-like protein [Candidatus Omnitrophica bacterium]|nr:YbhB/YbcL family Raf kinase inhibitor-like protein [Candidatus Omnitrophota bacterium]
MRITAFSLIFFLFFLTQVLAQEEKPAVSPAASFELTSPVFANNGVIPVKYTCRGSDINPPLTIKNIPPGTKSLALTVHDPHGISGEWVHWVVYNIKPDTADIHENNPPGTEALNDFGNFYYGGPCPVDERVHQYVFTLYALKNYLDDVTEGATKSSLEKSIAGKVIAKAELVGTYQNIGWEKNVSH